MRIVDSSVECCLYWDCSDWDEIVQGYRYINIGHLRLMRRTGDRSHGSNFPMLTRYPSSGYHFPKSEENGNLIESSIFSPSMNCISPG